VRLGSRVTGVADGPDGVTVHFSRDGGPELTLDADRCVLALSAHDMAAAYPGLGAERAAIVGALRYSTLWTILLATRARGPEPCVFVQVPTLVHPHLTAVMFEHNKHPGRMPDGMGLVSTYWLTEWYESMADQDDAAVTEAAVRAVEQVMPGTPLDLAFSHITRWRPAVLLARPGTWREVRRFHGLTPPTARVQFAGDYIGGSTTNSALSSGERAAGIVLANPA
jgi:protoporphyrinogen/coproporphyrinogen III oxidase